MNVGAVQIYEAAPLRSPEGPIDFERLLEYVASGIEKQTMKLKSMRRLLTLFREYKVDIILHGHVHESKEYFRKNVRFLNAGATIRSNNQSMKINYLTIAKGKIEVDIQSINFQGKLKAEPEQNHKNGHLNLVHAALLT